MISNVQNHKAAADAVPWVGLMQLGGATTLLLQLLVAQLEPRSEV